jgi:glycosyltransferase involved in cell wall biosynthesis
MESAVTPDRLGQSPILFLHTTTHRQIVPMVDWTLRHKNINPTVVILLRFAAAPNPYYPKSGDAEAYKKALDYIVEKGVAKHIRLVTDSDVLAEEYRSLPISVLPIPHTLHTVNTPLPGATHTMTYLGNARSTKGFQYLPHVVDSVEAELENNSWKAEFQANVLFERDRESVHALQLLRQRKVTLHESEMSVQDYNALLARSTMVIIPYQLVYYYAQTSGVMCEALAAGKVVIIPRGTWMSRQLRGKGVGEAFLPGDRVSLSEAVRRAMNNIDRLLERARVVREEWTQFHSPNNFAASLAKLV